MQKNNDDENKSNKFNGKKEQKKSCYRQRFTQRINMLQQNLLYLSTSLIFFQGVIDLQP
jgi:hypothetical protein